MAIQNIAKSSPITDARRQLKQNNDGMNTFAGEWSILITYNGTMGAGLQMAALQTALSENAAKTGLNVNIETVLNTDQRGDIIYVPYEYPPPIPAPVDNNEDIVSLSTTWIILIVVIVVFVIGLIMTSYWTSSPEVHAIHPINNPKHNGRYPYNPLVQNYPNAKASAKELWLMS
jgi:H+/Cl- antiporter ClcA